MLTKSIFIIANQHTFQTHIFSEIHFNKQENIIIKQKLNFLDSKVHVLYKYLFARPARFSLGKEDSGHNNSIVLKSDVSYWK